MDIRVEGKVIKFTQMFLEHRMFYYLIEGFVNLLGIGV